MAAAELEVGVLCATDEERAALAGRFKLARAGKQQPFPIASGVARGCRIHLAQAGIGKAATAALTAHLLTLHPEMDLVVFCGIAGGMHADLEPGDLVVAAETATHDYGALREGRLEWFRAGAVPLGPAPPPAYDAALFETPALARAVEAFSDMGRRHVIRGRIISGDLFLNCRDSRDRLHATWRADAVDMESAAFADASRRFGKPTLILRTISDRACEESHLTYEQMAGAAAANSAGFLDTFLAALEADPASAALIRAASTR